MQIEKVGIAGFGEQALEIAYILASAGYATAVWVTNSESVEREKSAINALLEKAIESETLAKEKKNDVLSRTTFGAESALLKTADLVIESVGEDIELKEKTLSLLSGVAAAEAVIASSTSCFSVTELSRFVIKPERVLGLHFVQQPAGIKLVEVVKTPKSSQETISLILDFCSKLKKETIVVKDSPGFIVNYLFVPYMNQALEAYDHGLASKEDLDLALHMGLGYPKGPIELINLIGPQKYLHLTSALYERLRDPAFAPPAILQRMVAESELK